MHLARFLAASLSLALVATFTSFASEISGTINGAQYTIARPDRTPWNGSVLLLAHGFRPDFAPLRADLQAGNLAYRTLLDEGWIVAATSYRRNGLVLRDAITDLQSLRQLIAKTDGPPKRVLVEGESMGGCIATLLAEDPDSGVDGVVAIGSALAIKDPAAPGLAIDQHPLKPIVFLSNQDEIAEPAAYVAQARPASPAVAPALFRASRDGHVNVNQRERLTALRALIHWLDSGRSTLPAPDAGQPWTDITAAPNPGPSSVRFEDDRSSLTAHVASLSQIYGNLWLDAQPSDLAAIGIARGQHFQLEAHGELYDVLFGRTFADVPRGEWVSFVSADGVMLVCRSFDDAAKTAHLAVGDAVIIRPIAPSDN